MRSYIVLLGPPGAGKGTQAKVIAEKLGLKHISSGEIFRENLQSKTELGKIAQDYVNRGELVPDDVTIAMIGERLARPDVVKGAVLDGFPRTPAQADALAGILKDLGGQVDAVPYIAVPEDVLIDRLSGRWTCREGSHVYHEKFNPPATPGKCDVDGTELYQREDDKPETVKRRIKVYTDNTAPLIEFYRQRNLLKEVDGTKDIDQVRDDILSAIGKGK